MTNVNSKNSVYRVLHNVKHKYEYVNVEGWVDFSVWSTTNIKHNTHDMNNLLVSLLSQRAGKEKFDFSVDRVLHMSSTIRII